MWSDQVSIIRTATSCKVHWLQRAQVHCSTAALQHCWLHCDLNWQWICHDCSTADLTLVNTSLSLVSITSLHCLHLIWSSTCLSLCVLSLRVLNVCDGARVWAEHCIWPVRVTQLQCCSAAHAACSRHASVMSFYRRVIWSPAYIAIIANRCDYCFVNQILRIHLICEHSAQNKWPAWVSLIVADCPLIVESSAMSRTFSDTLNFKDFQTSTLAKVWPFTPL